MKSRESAGDGAGCLNNGMPGGKMMHAYKKSLKRDKLQQVLDCFTELTGIRAAYYDNAAEQVAGKNSGICSFCMSIRHIPAVEAGCRKCDREAFDRAAQIRGMYLYKCHAGLWEAVVPMYIKNQLTGFLMLGQVKSKEVRDRWAELEAYLLAIGTPAENIGEIRGNFVRMPEYEVHKIEAAANMLEIIADHMINADMIHIYESAPVEKAKAYLQENYKQKISMKALAFELGLSQSSLVTLFKKETGHTITGFLENYRMNHAKELLVLTSLSVKEITFLSGYEDQNYFSRAFKRITKMSPVQYRDENKK